MCGCLVDWNIMPGKFFEILNSGTFISNTAILDATGDLLRLDMCPSCPSRCVLGG